MKKRYNAPGHLEPATKRWYLATLKTYQMEPHHEKILALAASTWDRAESARQILATEGMIFTDDRGSPRSRPEVNIIRDSSKLFSSLIKDLGFDIEEKTPVPGLRSHRRKVGLVVDPPIKQKEQKRDWFG